MSETFPDAPPTEPERALPPRLVLYDGVCGLCDRTVQWLLDRDPEGNLRFATLQGETGRAVLARHPELPAGLDSVLFVERRDGVERVSYRSRALFQIARHLQGALPRFLSIFRFVPAFLTDLGYRLVARVRYRIWGKLDACRVPSPGERARFLD
ncbi:MAG: DUF393 domain-containing protein [Myxococcales bacterium]|nr:DUF393 domain-containing protein [Myxococcales bacterium]